MSPPHFPIDPDGLRGQWLFEAIAPGRFIAGGCTVTALEVPHKGGRTFGYRIEVDGASIAYLPDHNPAESMEAGLRLATGVDVLLHGGMFADSEHAVANRYGHATIGAAAALGVAAAAGQVVIIHHAPTRTDDDVEALVRSISGGAGPVLVGREGDVYWLGG
jgi:ribonuclease BN (tRNA processing enzyme)